jgi:hypothetical protein
MPKQSKGGTKCLCEIQTIYFYQRTETEQWLFPPPWPGKHCLRAQSKFCPRFAVSC